MKKSGLAEMAVLRFLFAYHFALIPLMLINPYDPDSAIGMSVTLVPSVVFGVWVAWRSWRR